MRALYPPPQDGPTVSPERLAERYAYPPTAGRPWVRAGMVGSVDGAVAHDGGSGGLSTDADRTVFRLLRRLAEVILVGAGTARTEDYRGARAPGAGGVVPPVAVVTGSAALDPGSRLLTDTATAPIVLTTAAAPAARRRALEAAGADVVVLPDLAPRTLLGELDRRGLHRVLCEGGPTLLGTLLAADAVDELCLSVAPTLVAGPAPRITLSDNATGRPMRLEDVLEQDGTLLLRYTRSRTPLVPRTSDPP